MEWGLLSSVLKIGGAIVLGFPLLMYLLQDRLIFYPQPLADERRTLITRRLTNVDSVTLPAADGTRLHAWHVKAAPAAPLVIYFGGNAEEVSWMADEAITRTPGMAWLLVDYRGYGFSAGSPSEAALTADALVWYDHAVKEMRPTRIYLFGRSLGTGVAVQLAAQRPTAGLVLVSPFDSLVAVARHHYPFLPVSGLLKHRFDSLERAPRITAPLLCFAAERDEVIPIVHSKRLYDAWAGPKRWVELPGAGHNSTDGVAAFWPAIQQFLEKNGGSHKPD